MNPYELGQRHALDGKESQNPYEHPTEKWALYNRGYNKIRNPWMVDTQAKDRKMIKGS